MDDKEIANRINALIEEEHKLERAGHEPDHERMKALEVELDRCWDLLRQRRARRAAGENPDDAQARSAGTVEGYLQ
jgi:hypothetical protein